MFEVLGWASNRHSCNALISKINKKNPPELECLFTTKYRVQYNNVNQCPINIMFATYQRYVCTHFTVNGNYNIIEMLRKHVQRAHDVSSVNQMILLSFR